VTDLTQSVVDLTQIVTDLTRSVIDLTQTVTDLTQKVTDLTQSMTKNGCFKADFPINAIITITLSGQKWTVEAGQIMPLPGSV
jgi:uncharacterized protein YoxC